MRVTELMRAYRDGDEHGWDTEFRWILDNHGDKQAELESDIRENGITSPVLLGDDGRVWDGHHRILAATRLGIADIPVAYP